MTDWTSAFNGLSSEELDKLAVLRVMECANGVIQHMYRDKDPDALSDEDTRKAMGFSMSSIKRMQIVLESETIDFDEHTKDRKGRTVVRPSDAAKKSADTLLEEITPEEHYSDDGYAVIPMWYPTTLLPNGSRVFLFLKNYD